jgi:phosphate transport system permease protein
MATQPSTGSSMTADFDRRNSAWYIDKLVQVLVFIGGISAIIFVVGIFVFVTKEGMGFLLDRFDFKEFFTSPYWYPAEEEDPEYGILALIAGTASVTGLAMLVAIPFSLGAAVYIAEFSDGKKRETLKILIELLAAIPSVVWGFIALSIMNPLIIAVFDVPVGLTVLNAGIILGLMAAPIMTSIAEDALKAVPDRYREAAEAMGATRWQVITMAVLMATGHSINIPGSIFDSVRALTATIAAELGETAVGSDHYQVLFTIGIFLFVITFVINLTADLVVRGVRKG